MAILNNYLKSIADAIRTKKGSTNPINAQNFANEINNIPDANYMREYLKVVLENKHTQELVIPDYITRIKSYAFCGLVGSGTIDNANFDKLLIPSSVVEIGRQAFYNSSTLLELTLNKSVRTIGPSAFCGAWDSSKKGIFRYEGTVEDYLKISISGTETSAYNLKETFPISANVAEAYFKNDKGEYYLLEELIIPENVSKLNVNGLRGWNILKKLTIPNTVATVGEYCCSECPNLKDVTISEGITSIPNYMFSTSDLSGNVYLPSTLKTVGNNCFSQTKIESIVLPDSIETLGSYCFSSCKQLTYVKLPSFIAKIESSTFSSCDSLLSVTIPATVTEISSSALTIGSTTNKATIIMKSSSPCKISTNSFNKNNLNKIFVPVGTSQTYKSATNWSTYADYIAEPNTINFNIDAALLNNENVTYSIDNAEETQFNNTTFVGENLATLKVTSKNSDTTILVGTTQGASDIGTVTNASIVFTFEGDTTIYITLQQ